jgi:hypothetical protein
LKRPNKEVERKGNNYWYNNNLNFKIKILNNRNYLIYTEYQFFLKWDESRSLNYITFLSPLRGVTFFKSGFKSDPTKLFPSIVLVLAGEKRFPPPNFNLKIVRIQHGSGSWMLLDALLHCWEGSTGPHLKNVM